ncbi:MAG TPA: hypothetical protein VNU84_05865 [Candidatus Acidoferrum sp.]|jgi:hypothetical protein|nr:hypothetical protein [Candidatus Acidoferrum sp.]
MTFAFAKYPPSPPLTAKLAGRHAPPLHVPPVPYERLSAAVASPAGAVKVSGAFTASDALDNAVSILAGTAVRFVSGSRIGESVMVAVNANVPAVDIEFPLIRQFDVPAIAMESPGFDGATDSEQPFAAMGGLPTPGPKVVVI